MLRRLANALANLGGPDDASVVFRERIREELAESGLLGGTFTPEDYRRALQMRLGTSITVEEVPDVGESEWRAALDAAGHGAEVAYSPERGEAVVLVRASLRREPWPTFDLTLYHELSHLAAGHHLTRPSGLWRVRKGKAGQREVEARHRANWLVVAGVFGGLPAPVDLDRVA